MGNIHDFDFHSLSFAKVVDFLTAHFGILSIREGGISPFHLSALLHDVVSPKSISDYEKAEQMKEDYHFFACIHYISQVKTGPFAEHSNQLWNVSGVPSWNKVYTGLIKMYRAEVISKFPVIQHTYFGSIFNLDECKSPFSGLSSC